MIEAHRIQQRQGNFALLRVADPARMPDRIHVVEDLQGETNVMPKMPATLD